MNRTITDHLRAHILGLPLQGPGGTWESEWNRAFEAEMRALLRAWGWTWDDDCADRMRARLVMGSIRYGRLGAPGKPPWDRPGRVAREWEQYARDGAIERLVALAAECLVYWTENAREGWAVRNAVRAMVEYSRRRAEGAECVETGEHGTTEAVW